MCNHPYRGEAGVVCRKIEAMVNQSVFWKLQTLALFAFRWTMRSARATARRAPNAEAQTDPCIGFTKEKAPGISVNGFLIMMLIPTSRKSMEKSTTVSRLAVIVSGAIDMSASCSQFKPNLCCKNFKGNIIREKFIEIGEMLCKNIQVQKV